MDKYKKLDFVNYSNLYLSKYIDAIFSKLNLNYSFLGYSAKDVSRRIHQILARGFYNTYPSHVVEAFEQNLEHAEDVNSISVSYDFLVFKRYEACVNWLKFIKRFIGFVERFFYCSVVQFIYMVLPGSKNDNSYTVCRFYGFERNVKEENRQSFLSFLDKGNVALFHNGSLVLGMNVPQLHINDRVVACRRPFFWIFREIKFNLSDIVCYLFYQIEAFVIFLSLLFRNPRYLLLSEDIIDHAVIKILNKKKLLGKFVITNSEMSRQLLPWISLPDRNFELHFVCYSTNNACFRFSEKVSPFNLESPKNSFIKVDTVWTWTQKSRQWFIEFCQVRNVEVVGSILFKGKDFINNKYSLGSKRIVVFDVTPMKETWYLDHFGVDGTYYYYNEWVVGKFIEDIVEVVNKLTGYEILVKPKRSYTDVQSTNYISKLDSLSAAGEIKILDFNEDLFQIIANAAFVITIPFTSVIDIAREMDVPCLIYDASECLVEDSDVVSGKDNLFTAVKRIVGQSNCKVN